MQGRENAPELVRINFDRWERLNPDYELVVLDTREPPTPYLKADFPIDPNKLTVQTFSDILRVRLLAQNGRDMDGRIGLSCETPIKMACTRTMQRQTFFAYDQSKSVSHAYRLLGFWSAREDCPMIKKWNDLITRYWFMERERLFIKKTTRARASEREFYFPADIDAEMGLLDMQPNPRLSVFLGASFVWASVAP